MKLLIAMDSFKGSLSAMQACDIVREAFLLLPDAETACVPMADGGEGSAECLAAVSGGVLLSERAPDLFGREKRCETALLPDGTAVIETAQTAGLCDLPSEARDVLKASTYGVGVQIRRAIEKGCKTVIVCFGGSATNDGGLGALQALGVEFFDSQGNVIPEGAGGEWLERVSSARLIRPVPECRWIFACDVTNPYCGPEGAALVYGPQKGADAETAKRLDRGLLNFSKVLAQTFGTDVSELEGAGAAGGLCGGLAAVFPGEFRSGYEILAEASGLEALIAEADLVITGEGKTDRQTAFGKLPCRIGECAKRYSVPTVCLSGGVDLSATALYDRGITAVFDTVSYPQSLETAMAQAESSLRFSAENLARLIGALC